MSSKPISNIGAVILAAGKGTRLNCIDTPKVMLTIAGKPMIAYTVETLEALGFDPGHIRTVVGYCKEKIMEYLGSRVSYAVQEEQRGTAHAAYVGMRALPADIYTVLVLGGDDGMFYRPETLQRFVADHIASGAALSLLSAQAENPSQFGRIVRHTDGRVEIIEKEYLTDAQQQIREVSTGTFCFDRAWFERIFPSMPPLRKLGEYGLPTSLAMARDIGALHRVVKLSDSREWFGVNTPEELAEAQRRKRLHVSAGGVVYRRRDNGEIDILLMHRRTTDTYHFPKGTQEGYETFEETARREIQEETGCDVHIEKYLGALPSSFERLGERMLKQTHYFVARYVGGDIGAHDVEHDHVAFFDFATARDMLSLRGGQALGYEDEILMHDRFREAMRS